MTMLESPFSLREKNRMRGYRKEDLLFDPLTPTLSLRERELPYRSHGREIRLSAVTEAAGFSRWSIHNGGK